MNQLQVAVSHRYGGSIKNSQNYLDKFIKYQCSIPALLPVNQSRSRSAVVVYLQELLGNSSALDSTNNKQNNRNEVEDFLQKALKANNCSLRDVEKLIRIFEVFQITSPVNYRITSESFSPTNYCCLLGIAVQAIDISLANKIISGNVTATELIGFFGYPHTIEIDTDKPLIPEDDFEVFINVIAFQYKLDETFKITDEATALARLHDYLEDEYHFIGRKGFAEQWVVRVAHAIRLARLEVL